MKFLKDEVGKVKAQIINFQNNGHCLSIKDTPLLNERVVERATYNMNNKEVGS